MNERGDKELNVSDFFLSLHDINKGVSICSDREFEKERSEIIE